MSSGAEIRGRRGEWRGGAERRVEQRRGLAGRMMGSSGRGDGLGEPARGSLVDGGWRSAKNQRGRGVAGGWLG
ncbi:unnamed protein product [Linum trigynum]|uniref:Uncharacterized protein n=1 Tax=Linum trigynum TaxID=586398 RepID=A0AAV2ECM3_9ROSI